MKKALKNISFVSGFLLLLGGLLLYGLNRLDILNIKNDKLSAAVIIFGIGLIVAGACELFIKTTKEMQIEAKDERNVVIGKTAKAFAFDVMALLLSIAIVILVIFEFISIGAFFVLFGVYIVSQVAFIFRLKYLQNKM